MFSCSTKSAGCFLMRFSIKKSFCNNKSDKQKNNFIFFNRCDYSC
ncbi:hypothetical protein HMPREF0476_0948 [Kingella kingae ATCC 23330]|uniref:Uncharacterized protein n=1 Tax=Kingella kingae ATCC 23330 TaxID=887327 RepID=F5S6W5_KINKI|nr:hypothetical protein HMPREF0476_0948 [Kingella kingae ATCC 23330]